MLTLQVHNAHEGLFEGLTLLKTHGLERESRNGPVVRAPFPVATVYSEPLERVVSWAVRDANPFFHLYEALWMLAGRRDVAGPARYAKNMMNYSDDGETLHDAYGYRWRYHFKRNQLRTIINRLKKGDENDRQCVLQMWDARVDLNRKGKAIPCNLIATFQVDPIWKALDLVVFCRSNDIIWGTYGANAVHFGFLLEYVCVESGLEVGKYTQISVNYHAYKDQYNKCLPITEQAAFSGYTGEVIPMSVQPDVIIADILKSADESLYTRGSLGIKFFHLDPWSEMCHRMMWAHQLFRENKIDGAINVLKMGHGSDWELAGIAWLNRRKNNRELRIT